MFNRAAVGKVVLNLIYIIVACEEVYKFITESLDDVVEDAIKLPALATSSYLYSNCPNYFHPIITLTLGPIFYYRVDRFAEHVSDNTMMSLANISINTSDSLLKLNMQDFFKKEKVAEKVEQNTKHPYGSYEMSNIVENFVEDCFKFFAVQAILMQTGLPRGVKYPLTITTYVQANELGDKIGDIFEIGSNFFINNSLAYADIMLNSNEQTEL